MKLGRLVKVPVRSAWKDEAGDFTPWLAKESNIALLADELELELEVEEVEKGVGAFKADILCKDAADGHFVVIENQLERTNHAHLGQLLTYAAGLEAVTVVWIAEKFTEGHRAALDWLNEVTNERARFFGIEVELWQIGDSPMAPKFNVVSRPNDWSRSMNRAARAAGATSETKALYLRYWQGLSEFLRAAEHPLKPREPMAQHWTNFSIGKGGFHLGATVSSRERMIRVRLVIGHEKAAHAFAELHSEKDDIEKTFGAPLAWIAREGVHRRYVMTQKGADPADKGDWENQFAWLADQLSRFDKAFRSRIKGLDLGREGE